MKRIFALVLFLASALAVAAQADTSLLDHLSLRELLSLKVITASKTPEMLERAPATIRVITREQIRLRGYQSLLELLNDQPAIKVDDKMYSEARNSVTIRGIQGQDNFLILLNGVKISSPTSEGLPIMENFPVYLAEQVEVLYGPGSALYGADAVSGIINIITRKPGNRTRLNVDAAVTAGTYGYSNQTLWLSKKFNERLSFSAGMQYSYDRQPDLSRVYRNDPQLNTGHYASGLFQTIYGPVQTNTPVQPAYQAPLEAYNLYASLKLDDLQVSYFSNGARVPSAYGNNTQHAIYNKDVNQLSTLSNLTVSYTGRFDQVTSQSFFSYNQYKLHPGSNYRNLYSNMEKVYKYALSLQARAEQQVDYRPSEHMNFTAGVSFESFNVVPQSADLANPVRERRALSGVYAGTIAYYRPDGIPARFYPIRYSNTGMYVQGRLQLGRADLTIGARYDYNSMYGSSVNPRLGLVWKAGKKTTVKMFYGSAFRAPSPSTSYVQYGSFHTSDSGRSFYSDFLHLPNPGLKPVRSQNLELSLQRYISENLSLQLVAFYSFQRGLPGFADDNETTRLYNNRFLGMPVNYVEVFVNKDRQKSYGGTVQLNWHRQFSSRLKFSSYAAFSYVNGVNEQGAKESQETEKDRTIEFLSPVMFKAGGELVWGKLSFSPRLIAMGRQNIAGIGDTTGTIIRRQTLAGYTVVNASLRYQVLKSLSVYMNIHNALDARYRHVGYNMDLKAAPTELLYGQPQEPIRFFGGVQWTF